MQDSKKPSKGTQGYIAYIKKDSLIKSSIGIGIFLIIYVTCLLVFGTTKNYGTISAVLVLLPTAQFLSRFFGYAHYKSIPDYLAHEGQGLSNMTLLYEMIVIRGKKNFFVDMVVISNDLMLLYTPSAKRLKQDSRQTRQELQTMLNHKGIKTNIHLFEELEDLKTFISQNNLIRISPDPSKQAFMAKTILGSAM